MPGNIEREKVEPSLVTFFYFSPHLASSNAKLCPDEHRTCQTSVLRTEDHSVGGHQNVPRSFPISLPHAPCSGLESNIGIPGIEVHVTEEINLQISYAVSKSYKKRQVSPSKQPVGSLSLRLHHHAFSPLNRLHRTAVSINSNCLPP